MDNIVKHGRILFGAAIMALGIENVVCGLFRVLDSKQFPGEIVTSVIPWVPASLWLACFTGVLLFVAGMGILSNIRPRLNATLLGILFLVFLLALETHRLIRLDARTTFFETLAICGSALTLAGTLPPGPNDSQRWIRSTDWLIKLGPFLFAIASIDFGVDHLRFIRFVASLVPSFIPWHLFWAYFTALAFIAAGLSIGTRWLGSWAGFLLGTMFLLWFVLLHLPRAFGLSAAAGPGAPRNPNEWSSAFIALAMCGGSWIMSLHCLEHPQSFFHPRALRATAAD